MYKRYYDGYGPIYQRSNQQSGEVVIPKDSDTKNVDLSESATPSEEGADTKVSGGETIVASSSKLPSSFGSIGNFLDNIEIDDIILFGVILLVLKDSADDPLLIIILTVVFLAGILDK